MIGFARIDTRVIVRNVPNYPLDKGFMVARVVDADLWFYGLYDSDIRAGEVAREIGNGVVIEIKGEERI